MKRPSTLLASCAIALLAVMFFSKPVRASSSTFAFTNGGLGAQATFDLSGTTLTVTLSNTGTGDVLVPTDVLTGVAFNSTHTLNPGTVSQNGSSVFYGSAGDLNTGWGFDQGGGFTAQGKNSAIAAMGAFTGLGHSNFNGTDTALQGLDYGLLSAGDDSATGNTGVTGHGPLFENSAQFTFSADPLFSLSELGNSVVFQYGTATTDQSFPGDRTIPINAVPEPSTLFLFGASLVAVSFYARSRLSQH